MKDRFVWIFVLLFATLVFWLVAHPDIFGVVLAYGMMGGAGLALLSGYIYACRAFQTPWVVILAAFPACYIFPRFAGLLIVLGIYGIWLWLIRATANYFKI